MRNRLMMPARWTSWTAGLLFLLAAPFAGLARAQDLLPRRLLLDQDPAAPEKKPLPITQDQSRRQELEDKPDTTSFYPIPAIATGKNEGTTYGVLGALLLPDDMGNINKVLSFSIAWRSLVKINGFVDYRHSLGPASILEAYSYWAQKLENENQVYFDDRRFLDDYTIRVDFDEKRVGTERFFGTGATTKQEAESAYTSNTYFWQLRFGPYVSEHLAIQGTFRARKFRVGESLLRRIPQMLDLFPDEFGIEGGFAVAEGVRLTWDTRDSITTPTRGEYAVVFAEAAHYIEGGMGTPYQVYGIEGEKLWPHGDDDEFVFVARLRAQFVVGDAPFWELSTLGGGASLRSFGPNRFTDNDAWVLNLEERIRLFTMRIEGVTGEVQLAPFIDIGEVFHHAQDVARSGVDRRVHLSGGMGFRGVVHPYIVGRMDVGYGSEGLGITIGLDYPF